MKRIKTFKLLKISLENTLFQTQQKLNVNFRKLLVIDEPIVVSI